MLMQSEMQLTFG